MKNIYEEPHTGEILYRINKLEKDTQPQWGSMSVSQMLAHCSLFQDIAMGESNPKRGLLAIIVGSFAKSAFYNDKPLPQNMSTIPDILIKDEKEFEREKEKLKQKLITFQKNGPEKCTTNPHPFFGKLTPEQWGKGLYKHLDHHLRQFGV